MYIQTLHTHIDIAQSGSKNMFGDPLHRCLPYRLVRGTYSLSISRQFPSNHFGYWLHPCISPKIIFIFILLTSTSAFIWWRQDIYAFLFYFNSNLDLGTFEFQFGNIDLHFDSSQYFGNFQMLHLFLSCWSESFLTCDPIKLLIIFVSI